MTTVKREIVTGADMPHPLGPYSQVVRAGDLLFVSAQAGVDPATRQVPEGGIGTECKQALANLDRALRAAGSGLDNVVRVTLLYKNLDDLPEINEAFAEVFGTEPPARAAAIVGLAGGRLISTDAIATA